LRKPACAFIGFDVSSNRRAALAGARVRRWAEARQCPGRCRRSGDRRAGDDAAALQPRERVAAQPVLVAVAAGLVLDPAKPGNVCAEWIGNNWVRHAHARPGVGVHHTAHIGPRLVNRPMYHVTGTIDPVIRVRFPEDLAG
jgi:hypothetical protein